MQPEREVTGWTGWAIFAGVMLVMAGLFQAIEGLVALLDDEWYAVTKSGLVVSADFTAWGWTHIGLGVILMVAGASVLNGRMFGRVLGIFVAVLSAVANLAFMSAYPGWSIVIIAVDIFVIYALAVHGDELQTD